MFTLLFILIIRNFSNGTVSVCTYPINELSDHLTSVGNARDLAQEFREAFIVDAKRRMQSLPQEARERKIAVAFAKTREILDRNISVASSLATVGSQSDGDLEDRPG